jgi:hypothetical protein
MITPRRKEHRRLYPKNITAAVAVAAEMLLPYSHEEEAEATQYTFSECRSDMRYKARNAWDHAAAPIRDRTVLTQELRNLIAQGAVFVTKEFQQAATQVISTADRWEEIERKPKSGCYVRIRVVNDEQWVDLVHTAEVSSSITFVPSSTTSVPMEEVPEDIQGKVAVLSMAATGQWMEGVGLRMFENAFWLDV